MSRSISIWYRNAGSDHDTDIDVQAPYFLLGCQSTSKEFWNLPKLREIGLDELPKLGVTDPVWFTGWESITVLGQEIRLLQDHVEEIDFYPEVKSQWIAHLVYCYSLLISKAPRDSVPELMIG